MATGQDSNGSERQRFLQELEFVQCLANPHYVHWLAQNEFFADDAFVNYLSYLQYWSRPQYAKFIEYPHALFFLEILQDSRVRQEFRREEYCQFAMQKQFQHWQFHARNRR